MANAQLGAVVRHIRRLRALEAGRPGTDGELIAAFSARNDQAAFAGLLERYGPLVLGVCRRVLRQEQDAEDAFQATFLVLARRAGAIRKRESLGSWLHGVAYRVAMRARQQAARRRAREAQAKAAAPGDPSWKAAWQEVQVVLDQEVQALPEKYRAAFVLCCVEGCPQAEAARRLGVKEGTVWSRLAQARQLLQKRLARRGVALSAVLAATALAAGRAPAVPTPLATTTVKVATLFARAGTVPAGTAAANVLGLAKGVQKTMSPTTIKTTALLVLTAGAVALGLGTALHVYAGASPATAPEPPAAAGAPKAPPPAPRAEGEAVEAGGQVLGPDGKPFAGARLFVVTRGTKGDDRTPRATTGADGRFRVLIAAADLAREARLVVTAGEYGPDWVKLGQADRPGELTLRLAKDDLPVEGRVLDLEGRPLPGVAIQVVSLEKLFTLGIGHYTETDVKEAARALTGWTVAEDRFREEPDRHDDSDKTILGRRGKWTGDDLVKMLLDQPATAERLASRLCEQFMGEGAVDAAGVKALADGLRKHELDVGWAVETVLRSRAFFAETNLGRRVLGPVEFTVGTARALELFDPAPSTLVLADWCARLGQDLFQPPNVGGWPGGRAWLSAQAMIGRANLAAAVVGGTLTRDRRGLDAVGLARRHGRGGDLREASRSAAICC
jgi:RNA polymerase sigma factor (sigma-70 family)